VANLLAESLITLTEAARDFPAFRGNGKVISSTLCRWGIAGVRLPDGGRIRLEVVRLGSRFLTSQEAVQRFAAQLTAAHRPGEPLLHRARPPSAKPRSAELL
jgi:hypothetical protein